MLEPWIIEQIKRREQEREERLPLELPLPPHQPVLDEETTPTPADRGVIVIDLL